MSIRTILAPGVQINEIDKSQYSPAMTGSNCFVMGFTNKGEPYQPLEFTSRSAWQNYYGAPDNEAERYAYAAATEVLNQNGRLYFARLPYDNPAYQQVAAFKYNLDLSKGKLSSTMIKTEDGETVLTGTPFFEINAADKTIENVVAIEPTSAVTLYDLKQIDELRTDEAKVANNTFVIADIAFNTYGKIIEDTRKNEKCELIGIMPVVTTAANALYQQKLIDVRRENVIGYETVGVIKTLDAAATLGDRYSELSNHVSQAVKTEDMAKIVNTKDYYKYVNRVNVRITDAIKIEEGQTDEAIREKIQTTLASYSDITVVSNSWDGAFQRGLSSDGLSVAQFSFMAAMTEEQVSANMPSEYQATYKAKFGWHNPGGDDNVPSTVSQEANSFFPTIDFDGEKFDRANMKKIGVVVYKMYLDPSEGNKINFEPVEAYAGSLCKTDKDPNTGATTFIDTIINSQSKYINFFSNCFNTAADKKFYANTLDMLVVRPGAAHNKTLDISINKIRDLQHALEIIAKEAGFNVGEFVEKTRSRIFRRI